MRVRIGCLEMRRGSVLHDVRPHPLEVRVLEYLDLTCDHMPEPGTTVTFLSDLFVLLAIDDIDLFSGGDGLIGSRWLRGSFGNRYTRYGDLLRRQSVLLDN